jgi:hypothetical protein
MDRLGAIGITWTPCTFGGARPWWLCPSCGRRCAVLFLRTDGAPACRICHGINYEVQGMSRVDRLFARRDKVLARLGAIGEAASAIIRKPSRMRWKTFTRMRNDAIRFEVDAVGLGLELLVRRSRSGPGLT